MAAYRSGGEVNPLLEHPALSFLGSPTKLRRNAPVRIAHNSQTLVTDAALPAGLANICHTRGIEVIEAMPKPAVPMIQDCDRRFRRPPSSHFHLLSLLFRFCL